MATAIPRHKARIMTPTPDEPGSRFRVVDE